MLNTIDDLGYACNHALGERVFPTHPIEAYPRMVGNGINNLIRRALPEVEQTEENVLRVRECFIPYYNAHNCDFTRPYKGIPEVLQTRVERQEVLYIGDSLVGRDTAANAGVPFIACSWGFVSRQALTEAGVTRIIDRPENIVWSISERQEIYNHPE